MTDELNKAIRELLRVMVLAAIPVLIGYLQGELEASLYVALAIAVLRGLEKYNYKRGKRLKLPF